MPPYLDYKDNPDTETIAFHRAHLKAFFTFLKEHDVENPGALRKLKARGLISESLWKISAANLHPHSKYNLRYFSRAAHILASGTNRVPRSRATDNVEHEHVIPRGVLERMLFDRRTQPEEIDRLASYAIGCVVTIDEHKELNKRNPWGDDDPTADPWRRYREAGICVYDRAMRACVDLKSPKIWTAPTSEQAQRTRAG